MYRSIPESRLVDDTLFLVDAALFRLNTICDYGLTGSRGSLAR